MKDRIYILGGYQTDFALNYTRQGQGMEHIIADTVGHALESVAVAPGFIETFHIGNFIGELTARQGHLGGFVSELFPAFNNIPAARHEAACASGGVAVLAAISDILSGRFATAAVMGVELERRGNGAEVADQLGVAAWYERECDNVPYPWPKLFSDIGDIYEENYGLDHAHLRELSMSHYANAKSNEKAQTRGWVLEPRDFGQDDEFNPVVTGRIRKRDCSQITDGGAMIVLAGSAAARQYAAQRALDLSDIPYIKGWGVTTGPISLEAKLKPFRNSGGEGLIFPHLHKAIRSALDLAAMPDAFALDAIETHDCFTTSAYMAIDHFGITVPGGNGRAVEEGWLRKDGILPMNPSGGLIGAGHPVGATGVRMVLDAYSQVAGKANDCQVEDCHNVGTLNIGGSATTCVSFVVGDSTSSS